MNIEEKIKDSNEYPLLVRGTCVEEALWHLGIAENRFPSTPSEIHAFPIKKGFSHAKIEPLKPIPENYTLTKLRYEVLPAASVNHIVNTVLFNKGFVDGKFGPAADPVEAWRYGTDEARLGVGIYFNQHAILQGYHQDKAVNDRLHLLCSVVIPTTNNLDPKSITLVEPLGPTDFKILEESGYSLLPPRFQDVHEYLAFIENNKERITYDPGGQGLPQ